MECGSTPADRGPGGPRRSSRPLSPWIRDLVESGTDQEQSREQDDDDHNRGDPPPPQPAQHGIERDRPVDGHANRRLILGAKAEGFEADRGEYRAGDGTYEACREIWQQVRNELA